MTSHLVLPDAHVKDGESLERFTWFSKLILDLQPDVVINIGDFFDMESLCSFDVGHSYFEGRRLRRDLEAGWTAQDLIRDPIIRRKKKRPRFVALEGNHEWRLTKARSKNITLLDGIVDHRAFGWTDQGWEWYPYVGDTPAVIQIDGIHYTHFVTTQATSNAMSGVNIASSILAKTMRTVVQGHTHSLDIHRKVNVAGDAQWGIVTGCYIEDLNSVRYAGTGAKNWWSGVVYIEGIKDGTFEDIQFISMKTLRETYS
jgi:hypothetical protein